MTDMITREYEVEVKGRKRIKIVKGKQYNVVEGYVILYISLPSRYVGKKVRIRVQIEPT